MLIDRKRKSKAGFVILTLFTTLLYIILSSLHDPDFHRRILDRRIQHQQLDKIRFHAAEFSNPESEIPLPLPLSVSEESNPKSRRSGNLLLSRTVKTKENKLIAGIHLSTESPKKLSETETRSTMHLLCITNGIQHHLMPKTSAFSNPRVFYQNEKSVSVSMKRARKSRIRERTLLEGDLKVIEAQNDITFRTEFTLAEAQSKLDQAKAIDELASDARNSNTNHIAAKLHKLELRSNGDAMQSGGKNPDIQKALTRPLAKFQVLEPMLRTVGSRSGRVESSSPSSTPFRITLQSNTTAGDYFAQVFESRPGTRKKGPGTMKLATSRSIIGQSLRTLSDSASTSMKERFRFSIDASGACALQTLVLIVVCSAWENVLRRDVIRSTWASLEDRRLRVLFMVGIPTVDNQTAQASLQRESLENRDLVQANFIDTYANLSLKSLAMLQWTVSNCQFARFLVKADDDVFVNTPLMLRDLELTRHHRFIMGNVIAGARPSRDATSKWFTPFDAYTGNFYPKYIVGAAYVISGDLVRELYVAAFTVKLFWIEDVFITGMLLNINGVNNVQHIYNGKFDITKEITDPCILQRHILRHLSDPKAMSELWWIVTSHPVCNA